MYTPTPDYETKAKLHLGVSGNIIEWHEERSFGFVQTQLLPEKIFFHISVLVAQKYAPKINESVTIYAQYNTTKKRWQATKITSPTRETLQAKQHMTEHALIRPIKGKLQWAIPIVLLWLISVSYANQLLGINYIIVSLIALGLYAWDKRCAIHQNSRIPENSLHAVALLGGWSGALIARYLFRHKTQKQPFISIFWLTVIANIIATAYLLFSGSLQH